LLTEDTSKRLGELDREAIINTLKKIFERRQAGDVDGMMAFVAPDIVCFPETTWGYARYPRPIVGRENVREAFHQRHVNYINLSTQIRRLLVDGDQAAVHRTTTIRARGGGPPLTFDSVDFIRFRDGLVVEFCELPDGMAREVANCFPH
jgi:ketosteroid isomerase-like protein